ncbi:redox-sensing transcriptional repressor Rex [Spirochaetia bacterium 38H-sp]|uniref:Redox-sensing transcriptional repressor Rex n=1 Tax=Rarispira pelagica TaxID=3141764 RepID=A0ABU9U8T8_9SPIR
MTNFTEKTIPIPTLERLSALYGMLEKAEKEGAVFISSRTLGENLGHSPDIIRKDLSLVLRHKNNIEDKISSGNRGYNIKQLKTLLIEVLNIKNQHRTCIVGLGSLGSAILKYSEITVPEYRIVAGFDSNINKLELIQTETELFPSYMITEKISQLHIEIAILAVPPRAVEDSVYRLKKGGIKGIINFTPVTLAEDAIGIPVRNVSLRNEIRILSARL